MAGCSYSDNISQELYKISSYMENSPDSALTALQKIDVTTLDTKELKARHSLLLSIALDKNYIDKTEFTVLQPAIEYYENNGSIDEKMRMYYYRGRIFSNIGNEEKAMENYVKGLEIGRNSVDYPTKARLLFAKGQIHQNLYDYESYINSMMESATYFKKCNIAYSYFHALRNVVNGYTLMRDSLMANHYLEILSQTTDTGNTGYYTKFVETKIAVISAFNSNDNYSHIINEYLNSTPQRHVSWLTLANYYLKQGEYHLGLNAIAKYNQYSNSKSERYYSISSELNEKAGNIANALYDYKMYIKLTDSIDMAIFKHDTKFLEQKHRLELQNQAMANHQKIIIVIFLSIIIILGLSVLWALKLIKVKKLEQELLENERERYKLLCDKLYEEKLALAEMLDSDAMLNQRFKIAINNRINLINQFLKAHITANTTLNDKAYADMEDIFNNKDQFLIDTKIIFEASYPGFIAKLKEKNLSETELKYCCLYAIGLKGTHIGKYLGSTNIYNVSSSIRRKLGIDEYKSNIDKLLQEFMN